MRFALLGMLGISLGLGSLVGCDDTIESERSVDVKSDGTVVKEERKVEEAPDGTIKETETKSVDKPD